MACALLAADLSDSPLPHLLQTVKLPPGEGKKKYN